MINHRATEPTERILEDLLCALRVVNLGFATAFMRSGKIRFPRAVKAGRMRSWRNGAGGVRGASGAA